MTFSGPPAQYVVKPTGHRLAHEPGFPPYQRLVAPARAGHVPPALPALLFAPKPAPLSRTWLLWVGVAQLMAEDRVGFFFGPGLFVWVVYL
ncbi:hypothetical protein DMH18_02055 [Streptomyces sp. WAC 06783]|nr:hypothetical protein DMH18_02055 [Streptomyces sp. WAC 06783]